MRQAEFDKYKNDLAIDAAIKEAGAKDISDIKPHIDMEKVTFEDGKISGLSEQLEKIKTDKGYLFNSDEKKPSFGGKSGGGNAVTKARADFILNELNSALGTEYKSISDIIDANGNLTLTDTERNSLEIGNYIFKILLISGSNKTTELSGDFIVMWGVEND